MEESSSKRARDELEQEYAKKQKMDDDQKTAKMKELIKIIPDEKEEAIDAIPLDTKPPSIMLRSFDREDFGTLWKLVKAKHGTLCEGFKICMSLCWVEKRDPLTPAIITDMLNKKLKADHFNEMCYQLLKVITKQLKINECVGSILLVIMKLLMKKLDDFEDKYQVYGRIVRIKRLLDDLKVTAVKVLVTAAKHKLVLLVILMKNMAQEQHELTIKEKSTLFVQLLEKRKKHFAAKRAEEKRNRPPTRSQQRNIMCTEMEESSKKAEVMKEINSKRAGDELQQESTKKQKLDDDKERAELQSLMNVILDEEEVAFDAISLATKPPSIVDWKIVKKGNISYYQIIRVDGSSRRYSSFIQMLRSFDREDLESLWKLVKAKHGYTRPEEGYKRVLWGDLKTMFEHHVEDAVWRNLQESKVLVWNLFDSCGVHFVRFQNLHVFMLVEKRYLLTLAIITDILNKKLQANHLNEMCYQLFKLVTKQLKNQYSAWKHPPGDYEAFNEET
ncbi:hypothetical protein Tco_0394833 [Tanacetum coccineum]